MRWERKLEHIKEKYNEQVVYFQKLKTKFESELEKIETKLAEVEDQTSESLICPYCEKEYKSQRYYDAHIIKCEKEQQTVKAKEEEIERLQKELEEAKAERNNIEKESQDEELNNEGD